MATYTDTLGYNKGSAAHNANTSAAYCTTVEMDFAAITAARLAAGATALVNANAVASYATSLVLTEAAPNTVTGYSNGKYYSAADTIDVVFVNEPDTLVMRVWALVANCG
jgi:hypothetical protein